MTDFIKSFVLLPFVTLFVFGCLRACDIEYTNEQKQIEEWQAEQTYISPADKVIIDMKNGETK